MPIINIADAGRHICPFRNFEPCAGSKCMAWTWDGAAFERCETDNLVDTEEGVRPLGMPPAPEGLNWEADGQSFRKPYHQSKKNGLPPATGQRWVRQRDRALGYCGRCGAGDRYSDF